MMKKAEGRWGKKEKGVVGEGKGRRKEKIK